MTAVLGHLTSTEFGPGYKNWSHPPPASLFNAPILTTIAAVSPKSRVFSPSGQAKVLIVMGRTRKTLPTTSRRKQGTARRFLSGQIAIARENISVAKFVQPP